jgi:heme-degrading monooxygenase HmoA
MIEIVWEFVVKDEARGRFELAYGPGGAWDKLFSQSPGFRGITLLRDTRNPRHYLTFDLWDSAAHHEQALAEHAEEYARLDATFADWTESEAEVGVFVMLAGATVRPRPGAGRASAARRRPRRATR